MSPTYSAIGGSIRASMVGRAAYMEVLEFGGLARLEVWRADGASADSGNERHAATSRA